MKDYNCGQVDSAAVWFHDSADMISHIQNSDAMKDLAVILSWFQDDAIFLDSCGISPSLAQAFQVTATALATLSDSISAFTADSMDPPSIPTVSASLDNPGCTISFCFDFNNDNDLSNYQLARDTCLACDNDVSNHQLDRLVERDKLACLRPHYTLVLA
jgi:hypothetical protein